MKVNGPNCSKIISTILNNNSSDLYMIFQNKKRKIKLQKVVFGLGIDRSLAFRYIFLNYIKNALIWLKIKLKTGIKIEIGVLKIAKIRVKVLLPLLKAQKLPLL